MNIKMLSFCCSLVLFEILLNCTVAYTIKNKDSKAEIYLCGQFNNEGSLQKTDNRYDTKEYVNPNCTSSNNTLNTHQFYSAYLSNPVDKIRYYKSKTIQKLSGKQVFLHNNIVIALQKDDYERRFNNSKYEATILQNVDTSKQKTSTIDSHQRRPHTDPSSNEVPHIHTGTPHTRIKRSPKKPSGFVPPGLAKRPPGHGPPDSDKPHKGPPSHAGPPPNRGPPSHAGPPPHAGPPHNRGPQQNIGYPSPGTIPFIEGTNNLPQNTNNALVDNRFMDGDQNLIMIPTNMNVNGNNQETSNPQTIRPPMYWFQAQPVTPEE